MVKVEIIDNDKDGHRSMLTKLIKWNNNQHGEYDLVRCYYNSDIKTYSYDYIGFDTEGFNIMQKAFKEAERDDV